ncbi:DNA-binding protein [Vallitalea pronyensis]|uniref:UPF0122 protein HZI73_11990 n=1 Tax=Vallitalea pronyensis TaxID=1348613 RepID=A0A8J8MJS4_9FIRM|nr:DNA-binding protein [Vallitalea pronyensis]QUI22965.1 DNA-binding protein [Vallitalea pronyensis]
MKTIFEKTLLYDFYGELLTDHQKEIYERYHLDDLSLGEISEQLKISRQGVYDTVKRCDKLLENYENKLQLVNKFLRNKEKVNQVSKYVEEVLKELSEEQMTCEETVGKVAEIRKICQKILEDL